MLFSYTQCILTITLCIVDTRLCLSSKETLSVGKAAGGTRLVFEHETSLMFTVAHLRLDHSSPQLSSESRHIRPTAAVEPLSGFSPLSLHVQAALKPRLSETRSTFNNQYVLKYCCRAFSQLHPSRKGKKKSVFMAFRRWWHRKKSDLFWNAC